MWGSEKLKGVLNKGLETDRLTLRKIKKADVRDMYEYTRCNDTCKFLKWGPHVDIQETEKFINSVIKKYKDPRDVLWGIERKENKKLIGVVRIYDIDFLEEVGSISYILNKNFSGKGYMTEAVSAVINICFERLGLVKIHAYFAEGNTESERVMIRYGMSKTSKVTKEKIKDKTYNIFEYVISKEHTKGEIL